ncbi:NB-ARC domain-containing protein, partial [Streptomyces spiralis]|uniref:NB-ARC domain-containing protein n=1 Tax=Streptomyces spiralis TaxID=66376 RepID=UPI0036AE5FB8
MSISGYHSGPITAVHVRGREPVPWPHKVGVIPREAEAFQERTEARQLRTALANGPTGVLCQVLRGTGGVGKTQLAAHYARTAWLAGDLDVLVWISVSSRSAVISAYAQAAEELLAVEPGDPERSAKRFLALLDRPSGDSVCRWLVVLDDVVDPADLKELYPPECPHGRTLVTTRRRDAALPGQRINLGMFTPEQAIAYVAESLARHSRQDDMSQICALTEDLGYLPLALSQAVAYLIDTGLNCRAYRELLADRTARLEDLEPDTLPDDQPHAVRATWSLSIEHANRLRPTGMAPPMLQLATMLDPNGIPHGIVTSQPALDHLTASASASSAPATVRDAERALSVLHRLSLIDYAPDTPHQAVRTHQLIQRTVREALPDKQRDHLARIAADALVAVWPEIERDTALAQVLRANTNALTHHAEGALFGNMSFHPVLTRVGESFGRARQLGAAIHHFQHLVDVADSRLGPDRPHTFVARYRLAHWRGEAGDADGAATG